MPVSGYVLKVEEGAVDIVKNSLSGLENVTMGEAEQDRIPVAAYAENEQEAKFLGKQLEELPGVSAALLVYHNFEDVSYEADSATVANSCDES